ncbi:putative Mg2+ transporter-C (MgtC) family protein [Sphingomonas sp. BE123]|jgi:putative Mg2+ transporter-C (MgtC) family protein|uniref:MgtC/SapB family protein n=1 Tax=Sphingomonas sp. BE123 TaxID=2817842 RepID=UPI0028667025|nr:MgtC/SapB family protein [Sphingomonas sp. BE123]MDR6852729.1 putative Mg2+ transporter-C (MgtC) family protein [Sphingomonas sp. BE123]
MELNPPVTFAALGWDPWLRLGGAAIAGLLLGLDREVRGHGAGLRTHAILCFSAALITVSALALYYQLGGTESQADPLRVIEGTAAMAGVIGGALIVFAKGEIKNLTTAAHIWLAASIGIAFGAGLYPIAIIGTLGSVLLLTLFGWIEQRAFRKRNGQD